MTSFANMTQSLGASLPTVSASAQAPGGSGEQEEDSLPFIENYFTNLLGNINSGHNMQSNVASTSTPPKSYNIWPAQSTSTGHSYTKFNGREYNIVSSNKHQSRSKEDVSSLSPETVSVSCFRCERNPTIRCLECNDVLCHECCYKSNSECQLREHTILPIHQISPIGARPNSVPVDKETVYCETHGEPVRYYCEGCILFICQQCTAWIHRDHRYASLRGALDLCKVAMCTIMEHTRMGTKAIKSAIDKSVNVTKAFDKEAAEANMKIRKAMRSFVQAVEDREKCLLDKVEKMRLAKANEINDYTHALRGMLSGLSNVNDNLVRLMDSEGIELFMAKEKAKEQVECYAHVFKSMYLVEDRIIFQPPNYELLEHIKSLGDVQVVGSSTVAPSLSSTALSLPRQSSLYSLQPPSTYAGMSYQMSTSAILRSIPEYTYSHSRTTKYYDTSLAALDSNSPRGIGQAIAGYSSPISLKPTRSPVSGVPVFSFAREGQDEGQVSRPWGLCVDKEGNIIVADRRNNRIQIFNSRGHFKQMFGCKGTGPGQFDLPAGITTDHLGRIIVVDKDNHRVQIFTCRGNFIHKFGSYGKDCGQFQYPWDVAVNTLGNIVVTDTRNHRIQLFTSDGTYMRKFVFETTNPAKMLKGPTTPRGVCFTIYGNIIVSDFENHRLLMVDPTLSKLLCCIGREGTGICELNRPSGIITDDDGRVIVADSKNHRVLVFTSELRVLFAGDLKSPGLDDKDRPSDVALTPDGYLVVLFETLPDTARDITSHSKQYIKVY